MFWQKLIVSAHYLCFWSRIITLFDPKKDPRTYAFGLYVKKIGDVRFFGNFKKKSQKWPTQDLYNIERNKVMKNQPIHGIP